MKLGKRIEAWNKRAWYRAMELAFKNKPAELPLKTELIRKILIFRYDAIGDMVVTTPVFELLKERIPQAEIHVVTSPWNRPVIASDERIAKIYEHDGSMRSFLKLISDARGEKYDCAMCFVLFRTTYAGILANLVAGKDAVKATILHKSREKMYGTFFNVQIPWTRDTSTMAELQVKMVCDIFGWEYDKSLVQLDIRLNEKQRAAADIFLKKEAPSDFFVMNLSAGKPYRRFSVERNVEFLKRIFKELPEQKIVLVSSPQDTQDAQAIAKNFFKNVKVFPPTQDIMEVAALIEKSALVISPDTSIVHIASALKKPTLAFYSYMTTFVMEWMPFGVPYRKLIAEGKEPISAIPLEDSVQAFFELHNEVFPAHEITGTKQ